MHTNNSVGLSYRAPVVAHIVNPRPELIDVQDVGNTDVQTRYSMWEGDIFAQIPYLSSMYE